MSYQAMAWAVKQKAGSTLAKTLLLSLANYADENGRCWPSQERLSEDCECSKRSIMRAVSELESKGFLSRKERRRADGTRASDMIVLSLESQETVQGDNLSGDTQSGDNLSDHGDTVSPHEPVTELSKKEAIASKKVAPELFETSEERPPLAEPEPPPKQKTERKASRLPDDWEPTPKDVEYALSKDLTLEETYDEADRFRNHWTNEPGGKGRKLNWSKAWQNWVTSPYCAARKRRGRGMAGNQNASGSGSINGLAGALVRHHSR